MKSKELGLLINALNNKDSGFYLVEAPDNTTLDDLMLKIKWRWDREVRVRPS